MEFQTPNVLVNVTQIVFGFGILFLLSCLPFGAYIAATKGRSWLEGLLFGLFLGPLGLLLAVLLPDRLETPEPQSGTLRGDDPIVYREPQELVIPPEPARRKEGWEDSLGQALSQSPTKRRSPRT